jgi:hypothetical protein
MLRFFYYAFLLLITGRFITNRAGFQPHLQQLALFFSGDKGKNLIVVFLVCGRKRIIKMNLNGEAGSETLKSVENGAGL